MTPIEIAASISLIVLFIHACFQDGMIFGRVGRVAMEVLPDWLFKPIIGCVVCMTPYHGALIYAIGGIAFPETFPMETGRDAWRAISILAMAAGYSVIWSVLLTVREFAFTAMDRLDEMPADTK